MLEKRLFRYDLTGEDADDLQGPPEGWEAKVPLSDEENVAMLQELSECYAQLGACLGRAGGEREGEGGGGRVVKAARMCVCICGCTGTFACM